MIVTFPNYPLTFGKIASYCFCNLTLLIAKLDIYHLEIIHEIVLNLSQDFVALHQLIYTLNRTKSSHLLAYSIQDLVQYLSILHSIALQ